MPLIPAGVCFFSGMNQACPFCQVTGEGIGGLVLGDLEGIGIKWWKLH